MVAKKQKLTPKIAPKAAKDSAPPIKSGNQETIAASMSIEMWSIHKVRPYAKNPRAISQKAIQKVSNSLQAFGWRQPLVVDARGVLVVGHTRYEAAKSLGMVSVPVHVASDLDAIKLRAYRLADNKTGEISKWHEELLGEEMDALELDGVDLGAFGFREDAAEAVLADMAKAEAEAAESTGGGTGGHIKCPECGHQWSPKEDRT